MHARQAYYINNKNYFNRCPRKRGEIINNIMRGSLTIQSNKQKKTHAWLYNKHGKFNTNTNTETNGVNQSNEGISVQLSVDTQSNVCI